MSAIELIIKDISDAHVRENFFRLSKFINGHVLFDGDLSFFDVTINEENDSFPVKHGLDFIPTDVIELYAEGNQNFSFIYQDFDKDNIYVDTDGPVRLRFLAGRLSDKSNRVVKAPLRRVTPDFVDDLPFPPFTTYSSGLIPNLDPNDCNKIQCDTLPISQTRQELDLGTIDAISN